MEGSTVFLIAAYAISILVLLSVQFFLTYLVIKKMSSVVESKGESTIESNTSSSENS